MAIPVTLVRIYDNIWILNVAKYFQLFPILFPAVVKIAIAFTQILVMVELTIAVEQD